MRRALLVDMLLGFALSFFQAQKNTKAIGYVKKVIELKNAGKDVDDHMQAIADYLQGGNKPNFDDLKNRVNSEVDELLGRGSGAT